MTLTVEQKLALARGKAVPVTVDGGRYVLLQADVFERAQSVLGTTDLEPTYPAVLQAWDAEGDRRDAEAYSDLGRVP